MACKEFGVYFNVSCILGPFYFKYCYMSAFLFSLLDLCWWCNEQHVSYREILFGHSHYIYKYNHKSTQTHTAWLQYFGMYRFINISYVIILIRFRALYGMLQRHQGIIDICNWITELITRNTLRKIARNILLYIFPFSKIRIVSQNFMIFSNRLIISLLERQWKKETTVFMILVRVLST